MTREDGWRQGGCKKERENKMGERRGVREEDGQWGGMDLEGVRDRWG